MSQHETHKVLWRVQAGPSGIPKHMLAKRLGMTSKKAHKMLAAFQKRYGIQETEQQQGRVQMKARRRSLAPSSTCCSVVVALLFLGCKIFIKGLCAAPLSTPWQRIGRSDSPHQPSLLSWTGK